MKLPVETAVRFCVSSIAALLVVLTCLDGGWCTVSAANPKDELRGVKQKIQQKQRLIQKTRKVEAEVSTELQTITHTLQRKEAELKQMDRELASVEVTIHQTSMDADLIAAEAQQKKLLINRRLGSLYKAGELGAVRMFFSAESFPQMAENMRYMRSVLDQDRRVYEDYQKKIEELHQLKLRLEKEAVRKERLKGNILAKKQEIEEEKTKKTAYLGKVRQDRQGHEKSLKTLQANAARLQNMLSQLEAQSRRKAAQKSGSAVKGKPLQELPPVPDRGFASQKGRMRMPAKGQIIETFGTHKHPEFNSYTNSKGIVIAASLGSDVRAIYEGTVVFAGYFKGYGNMVIIDHGGGYFSLYAYTSRISRKVGADVAKGDVVAAVGDVDSSRGPALYFEIRYQGKPLDPSGWVR